MKFVETCNSYVFKPGRLLIMDGQRVYDVVEPSIEHTYPDHAFLNEIFSPASHYTLTNAIPLLEAKVVEAQERLDKVKEGIPAYPPGEFSVGDKVYANDGNHMSSPYTVRYMSRNHVIIDRPSGVAASKTRPGWTRFGGDFIVALRHDLIRRP